MDNDVLPPDDNREIKRALEVSDLTDEVEVLARRMSATVGAGIAITALFVVAGVFMEKGSTLWFLGFLWLLFTFRLVLINRTSGAERLIKEAALERLASPPPDDALPSTPE